MSTATDDETEALAHAMLLDADGIDREIELDEIDLDRIGKQCLLWIDVRAGEDAERVSRLLEGLGVPSQTLRYALEPLGRPRLDEYGDVMHVEVSGLRSGEKGSDEPVVLNCVVGRNWLLTSHDGPVEFLEEFRERAQGGSDLGALDAPSFLATVLDWQVTSYHEAIADLVATIDELDEIALGGTERSDSTLNRLVSMRRRIGWLRGLLAPHQQVYLQLAKPELDLLSTSDSAAAFRALNDRVAAEIDAVDSAREMLLGSFDVLMTRTAQRTNDVMKVLTLASVILLPSSLIAGILGMNFHPSFFDHPALFWVAVALMAGLMATTILTVRHKHWL